MASLLESRAHHHRIRVQSRKARESEVYKYPAPLAQARHSSTKRYVTAFNPLPKSSFASLPVVSQLFFSPAVAQHIPPFTFPSTTSTQNPFATYQNRTGAQNFYDPSTSSYGTRPLHSAGLRIKLSIVPCADAKRLPRRARETQVCLQLLSTILH